MDPVISIGAPAPDFTLFDLEGEPHRLEDCRGRVALLNFWSAECPHSARADRELVLYLKEWGKSVVYLPVASNANETPELIRRAAAERGLTCVLHDPQAHVADLYGAQTTPHLFVIDGRGILRYQGAFDDVTFRQRQPARFYLRQAVESVLAGQDPDPAQTPPYGCTIVRYAP